MKVLHHNEWDLLSLITLYSHSTYLLFEQDQEESAKTFTNIGKWYGDLRESTQSVRVLEKVTSKFDALEAGHAQYYLAIQHKRINATVKLLTHSWPLFILLKQEQSYMPLSS